MREISDTEIEEAEEREIHRIRQAQRKRDKTMADSDVTQQAIAYLVLNGIVNCNQYWPDRIAAWAHDRMLNEQRVGVELVQLAIGERNSHAALVAERERLRAALHRLSVTGRGALPLDEYRDWVKEVADEVLATGEQGGDG